MDDQPTVEEEHLRPEIGCEPRQPGRDHQPRCRVCPTKHSRAARDPCHASDEVRDPMVDVRGIEHGTL
jgi:hypothetical protein